MDGRTDGSIMPIADHIGYNQCDYQYDRLKSVSI